jgi:microcystin-dependent protein
MSASIINTYPTTLQNGQLEDATVVMTLFAWIQTQVNGNACGATTGSNVLKGDGAGNTTSAVAGTDYLGVTPGLIFDYAGTSAPTGYLLCDGSAVSRTTYANLFNAIGTTWGVGDGSTTFNVPDLRRKTTIGSGGTQISGPANTVGAVGGVEAVTIAATNLPAHTHSYSGTTGTENATHTHIDSGHNHPANIVVGASASSGTALGVAPATSNEFPSGRVSIQNSTANLGTESAAHAHTFSGTTDNGTGGGTAITNMQPTAVVTKIIKV